jgi:FGGY-family pentulose kinase
METKNMNQQGPLYLTFDVGTESVRCGLFNTSGKCIMTHASEHKTYYPRSGWAEQTPEDWWTALIEAGRLVVDRSGVHPESIEAICIDSTTCTVIALDEHLDPIGNALLWMDMRSYKQAEKIAECGHPALKYNGFGEVSPEWMPSKALWIKEQQPEIYAKARWICECQDWINYRLTGEITSCLNNTITRWYYDIKNGGWPESFYSTIGLGDIIEKYPSQLLPPGAPIGTIHPSAAEAMGLSPQTTVIQGGVDGLIALLGLNVVRPGRTALITGSSHILIGLTSEEINKQGLFGGFLDALIPGLYLIEAGQVSTGSILKWFKESFLPDSYRIEAEKMGRSIYDQMNSLAAVIPIGSEGLVLLDYWQGNRTPLTDPKARGALWGLSLKHTPVHVYRAVMEGVAYSIEHIRTYFEKAGYKPEGFYACGGATRSRLWMQMHADVSGVPVHLTEEPNAPLLGDAVLAAYGTGAFNTIEAASDNMVHMSDTIEPNTENREAYEFYYDKYIKTYQRLKDLMHEVVDRESGS